MPLSARFTEAFAYAALLHADQVRKGTSVPYVSHLMAVAAIVLENGGDEDTAIAALLHDAVEDQGGYATLDRIRSRFGERAATIVDGCTDAYVQPKPPWEERKSAYIAHLREAPDAVRLVSAADKLHNARAILADLRDEACGQAVWERFSAPRERTLWYYRQLTGVFTELGPRRLAEELDRVVSEIESLCRP
jgi:(p)ppGpp synthase/HD superfamily hydrolase